MLPGQTDQGRPDHDDDGHWEFKLNLFSAFTSLLCLIILVALDRPMEFKFQTWAPFTTSVRSQASMDLVQDFTTHYENVCEIKTLSIATFNVNVSSKNNEKSNYLVMPLAYEEEELPASLLLIWVLAVSAAFQTYRGKFLPALRDEDVITPFWAKVIILLPHIVAHGAIMGRVQVLQLLDPWPRWIFLGSLTAQCFWIILDPFGSDYLNTTPDFGRWLEYTLTAPVQVILVAVSVWLRDRSTLYALFAAQASMMLCGVVMENCIDDIYELNITKDEDEDKKTRVERTSRGTLFIAWITFGLIWYVLISQFLRQAHIDGKCDDCGGYIERCPYEWISGSNTFNSYKKSNMDPNANYQNYFANATLNNETLIKNTFCKACPTEAPDNMCKIKENECVGRSNIPPAVTYIVFAQCFLFASFGIVQSLQYALSSGVTDNKQKENAWYEVSIAYAVLSVTAKTTLEIAFLAMLAQMPESVVSA